MSLSSHGVIEIYEKLKANAYNFYKKGDYVRSLNHIVHCAKWAYRLNFRYADLDLELLLKSIIDCSLPSINVHSNESRFVLLESHGMDNRGLTQQYIRAFIAMGVEFLYISVDCLRSRCSDIIRELETYGKAKVILYENSTKDYLEKSKSIIAEIESYQPTKIFLHLMPWDVVALSVTHSIKGVLKYNINLTDHAFWLGTTFIDYNFEFRSYGKTVSLEERNLKENQLLFLPFYPILSEDKICFQGFPPQTANKIIILTGGAFYKMFGNNNYFFFIIDSLLDLSKEAVILIAGDGNIQVMNSNLSKLKNKERVFLIGNRKDINEVFKASDIYLDTYPIRGGLMEQYASLYGKPILAYSDFQYFGDIQEQMLLKVGNGVCGYDDWKCFIEYARKVLDDKRFRIAEGEKNRCLVPTAASFNVVFQHLITAHANLYEWKNIPVDYQRIRELNLSVENEHTGGATRELIKYLGIQLFWYFPKYSIHFICEISKVFIEKITNKK